MEKDPARRDGRLSWLWEALRLAGWRRSLVVVWPLLVAAMLAIAHSLGAFSVADALFHDAVSLREPGRTPRVAIVRQDSGFAALGTDGLNRMLQQARQLGVKRVAFARDPGLGQLPSGTPAGWIIVARKVERAPGQRGWRFVGAAPPAPGIVSAARVLAPAEHGLHRRQLGWLKGENTRIPMFETAAADVTPSAQSWLVRLSLRQSLPRIDASQIVQGSLGPEALRGVVLLVEPPLNLRPVPIVTARGETMRFTEFNAAAIQTLTTMRAAREMTPFESALILTAFAALAGAIYLRFDPKRIMPLLLLSSLAVIVLGAIALLVSGNLLVPVSALVLAQPLSALLVLHRAELDEDRNLRRFVTQTINLSSRQILLKDMGRLPLFLSESAKLMGIDRFLLIENRDGRLELLARQAASLDDCQTSRKIRRALFRKAAASAEPVDAAPLVPGWPGGAQLAALGPAQGAVYWLYSFASAGADPAARAQAAAIARDYRAIQQLRADLGEGADRGKDYRPTDQWAGGAVSLIAGQGGQIAEGMDALETAVMVFHPIGFPIRSNQAMSALYDKVGLPLGDTTLAELAAALTVLDQDRISASLGDLLLHGGEMRVHCRELDSRMRMLRIAAPQDNSDQAVKTMVVEAIDITEPRRLAQLRLSISNLLDASIRNDLEAISFAAAMARTGQLPQAALDRLLEQIETATDRATARLSEMAPHMREAAPDVLSQAYPVDALEVMREASAMALTYARELDVEIAAELPGLGGHVIADPRLLADMVDAMLRIIIADTPVGESAALVLGQDNARARVTISGGIGMAFERLYAALECAEDAAPGPYRAIAAGMRAALSWGAVVSYSSEVGKGYRFVIDLRRIG